MLDLWRNELSGPIPPELGNLSDLGLLSLGGTEISGPIPPELGNLSNLRSLFLESNELSGPIPPELGNLSNLRSLFLGWNELSGSIPPKLGALPHLQYLRLSDNALAGSIPPELGNLAHIEWLVLASNRLSGAIPPELGSLSELTQLDVADNALTGSIPSELGGLSELTQLDVAENAIAGPIPPELGNLTKLHGLFLEFNDLVGGLPSEFGGLADLRELNVSGNAGLTGPLPAGLTDLRLESMLAGGTDLCAPRRSAFEAWLQTLAKRRIALCGEAMAYLTQAVQSGTHPVPLIADEPALLRIFVTAVGRTTEKLPPMRARFFIDGIEQYRAEIPQGSTSIPEEVDEGDLSKSATSEIPGDVVRPGLEMVIDVDPEGVLDERLGVPTRIPEEGRLSVPVREMPPLNLTVIPFLWTASPDSSLLDAADDMAANPQDHLLLEETHILLPVGELRVAVHEPVLSTSNSAFDVLDQVEVIRLLGGGAGHYVGLMLGVTDAGGLAYTPGRSSFSLPSSSIIAHELGHNMSLWHAPCGGAGGADPLFPYPDGGIGAWGYDSRAGRLVEPISGDLMSYCEPHWISDYHFTNALEHRLLDERVAASSVAAVSGRSLLVWGGVDADGEAYLNPAFVVEAPAALPDSTGNYAVTGRDAGGGELFSLSFAMPVVADGDGASSFVFAVPADPAWEGRLASVTLSGADEDVVLDGSTNRPMAILRDPASGQVRGFFSDLSRDVGTAAAAATAIDAEPGMRVLFSRGIPDAAAWRR